MNVERIGDHLMVPELLNKDSFVVDVGAHKGDFATAVRERFSCDIACFEPDKEFAQIVKDKGFFVFNMAVSAQSGKTTFYKYEGNGQDNGIIEHTEDDKKRIVNSYEVETMTVYDILGAIEGDNIDLLKLDCEGSEVSILLGLNSESLSKIRQITVEFHNFYDKFKNKISDDDVRLCVQKLQSNGYLVAQHGYDFLFVRP